MAISCFDWQPYGLLFANAVTSQETHLLDELRADESLSTIIDRVSTEQVINWSSFRSGVRS